MTKTFVYDKVQRKVVELGSTKSVNSTPYGIVNMEYRSPKDGSYFEKGPMSKTYIEHIRSRNSESIKRMKPNMGAYGA